jgi:hypothetical protein
MHDDELHLPPRKMRQIHIKPGDHIDWFVDGLQIPFGFFEDVV